MAPVGEIPKQDHHPKSMKLNAEKAVTTNTKIFVFILQWPLLNKAFSRMSS